jgi:hypothetical protein
MVRAMDPNRGLCDCCCYCRDDFVAIEIASPLSAMHHASCIGVVVNPPQRALTTDGRFCLCTAGRQDRTTLTPRTRMKQTYPPIASYR